MGENGRVSEPQDTPTAAAPKPVLTPKQAKRANSSVIGMLIAVAATLGLVVPVILLNPTHTAETYARNVDVATIAEQAEDAAGYPPLAVSLPEGWTSNFARWNGGGADGVAFWEVGYLTPEREFIQLTQTDAANPTWTAQRTGTAQPSGQRDIESVTWELLDSEDGDAYLTAEVEGFTLILNGTAELAEFDVLGGAVVNELR